MNLSEELFGLGFTTNGCGVLTGYLQQLLKIVPVCELHGKFLLKYGKLNFPVIYHEKNVYRENVVSVKVFRPMLRTNSFRKRYVRLTELKIKTHIVHDKGHQSTKRYSRRGYAIHTEEEYPNSI